MAYDPAPENLNVGVINPYALVESIVGKKIDWSKPESAKVLEKTLQTDYHKLFDIKHNSPLYAGLKHNPKNNTAEKLAAEEMNVLTSADLQTPDLSKIEKVGDLRAIGLKEICAAQVSHASFENGKLNLELDVPGLVSKLSNTSLTKNIRDLATPFGSVEVRFTPVGYTWKDGGEFFKDVTEYNDPIQGAVGNCYLIAALAAVAWTDPLLIVHRNRPIGTGETNRTNAIDFFSKGPIGQIYKNGATKRVEVTDKILFNSWNQVAYCRSNDLGEIWPSLYEKAFAKWITGDTSDVPNITLTAYGDPAKTMAQINNKTPYYYATTPRTANELYGIVAVNSLGNRTIYPMTAWTYPSGNFFTGSNIAANHAYTVLGYTYKNGKQYIILRNPWGVVEPAGLSTYQGLLWLWDETFWLPLSTTPNDGVFALESWAFKLYFSYLAVAK